MQDPQIGQALALVHRPRGRPWTIAALAHEVAMSRSAFAALVGELVVAYLTRWRMQVAAAALADGQATIGEWPTGSGTAPKPRSHARSSA